MTTTVYIAFDVPQIVVDAIRRELAFIALHDVDFNGAEFEIERDEQTSIADYHDASAACRLLARVFAIIQNPPQPKQRKKTNTARFIDGTVMTRKSHNAYKFAWRVVRVKPGSETRIERQGFNMTEARAWIERGVHTGRGNVVFAEVVAVEVKP